MQRIAAIGDPHGCFEEFKELLDHLNWISLDEIWVLGDLVDRGPDSAGVVGLCRERNIPAIMGNHEESILRQWKRVSKGGELPQNEDKKRTLAQLTKEDFEWIEALPIIHALDAPDQKVCFAHGGVWPTIPLWQQPKNVVRCQMVHPNKVGDTRWWGKDAAKHKSGKTEEANVADGYIRWYEVYNHDHDTYYGHSVFTQPFLHQREGYGRTVGIDTGSCFGGALTAAIIGDGEPWFVTVKAKKVWFENSHRVHQE